MKKCKKCDELKSVDAFSKCRTAKDGLQPICKACQSARYFANRDRQLAQQRAYQRANPERVKASKQAYLANGGAEKARLRSRENYAANPAPKRAKNAAWREANPERFNRITVEWARRNPERRKSIEARYFAKNPEYRAIKVIRRKVAKVNASVSWANEDKIREFYVTAEGLRMLVGEWYEVDHIVPLLSKVVCGLHCEQNMQVLSASENARKGNRYWPDMW